MKFYDGATRSAAARWSVAGGGHDLGPHRRHPHHHGGLGATRLQREHVERAQSGGAEGGHGDRVTSSANPSVFGQSVTFTATVTVAGSGRGPPAGTVTFYGGDDAGDGHAGRLRRGDLATSARDRGPPHHHGGLRRRRQLQREYLPALVRRCRRRDTTTLTPRPIRRGSASR